jgi:hypothetical protein
MDERVSGRPVTPQDLHAGAVNTVDPRAISSVASRPAPGGAPSASTSRAGCPASAAARLRSACPFPAAASTAAAT